MMIHVMVQKSSVTVYAKCGYLEQSCAVFRGWKERFSSWNAVIAGYAQTEMAIYRSASIGALNQGKWPHNFVIQNFLWSCTLLLGRHSSSGHVL
ncbi:hypothetical protein SLEP1_g56125 [Rubroshorea leprosula]|uniref:Uncharacterized protein n=1 Tax=Rubroshorea leprosula TaxID=152421 RepID=A0AAV5MHF2_9ROSI|nr:hypothetical protein SLEP1_g56125 [Rubroshorea leprosula]